MSIIYLVLGLVLTVLFFLNIKNAADFLCKICGGFSVLIIYNTVAPLINLCPVGINFLSALTVGIMGIPGGILLILLSAFF